MGTPVAQNEFVDSIIPINLTYINNNANEQLVSDLVLRKNTNPLPVLVELKKSIPSAVNYNKQWHKVKHIIHQNIYQYSGGTRDLPKVIIKL